MAVERDFIMRQIRLLFELIEKIIRSREKGNREEALKYIQVFYQQLKIDPVFQDTPLDDLLPFLRKQKNMTTDQIELLAFVLKEQGELSDMDAERLNFFRRSYILLEQVERDSLSFSMDRQMKIAELLEHLN